MFLHTSSHVILSQGDIEFRRERESVKEDVPANGSSVRVAVFIFRSTSLASQPPARFRMPPLQVMTKRRIARKVARWKEVQKAVAVRRMRERRRRRRHPDCPGRGPTIIPLTVATVRCRVCLCQPRRKGCLLTSIPTDFDNDLFLLTIENYLKMCEQASSQPSAAAPPPPGTGGFPSGGGGGGGNERDASGREICRDYLRGRCGRATCRFSHGEAFCPPDLRVEPCACADRLACGTLRVCGPNDFVANPSG